MLHRTVARATLSVKVVDGGGAGLGRTPLQEQLGGRAARPTALDAFRLARRAFLDGRRVDMGVLARELDVNRATLYRWVGTREHLLVEVLRRGRTAAR